MGRIQKVLQRDLERWAGFVGALSFLLGVNSFVQSLRHAIRSSRLSLYLALAGVALVILATVLYFRRELRRSPETHESTANPAEASAGAAKKDCRSRKFRCD